MSENIVSMKADLSGLVDTWGTRCLVGRLSTSQTASGRFSGSYTTVASASFVIEPIAMKRAGGNRETRMAWGLMDGTTHMVYARLGTNVSVEDRLTPSGSSYWLDIMSINNKQTAMVIQAKQVKRT